MAGIGDMTLRVTADLPLSDVDAFKSKLGQTKETVQQLKSTISDVNAALSQNATNLAVVSDNLIKLKSSGTASATSVNALEKEISGLRNESTALNSTLTASKLSLDAETASLKLQSAEAATAQRSHDALGKAVGRFTDGNLVAAREVNNLGRRLINIGSIAAFEGIELGVQLLGEGLVYLFNKLSDTDSGVTKLKDEQLAFTKSLEEVGKKAYSTGAELTAFVNIAKDGTLPLQQRNNALIEANKILGDHATKLTLANVGTAAATLEVQKYTQALINEAVAAAYASRIGDLRVKQTQASHDYTEALKGVKEAQDKLNAQSGAAAGESGIFDATLLGAAFDKVKSTALQYREISDELITTNNDLYATELKVTSQTEEHGKATKKAAETIADVLSALRLKLGALNTEQLNRGIDESKEKINAIQAAIDKLQEKFKLSGDNSTIITLYAQLNTIQAQEDVIALSKKISTEFGKSLSEISKIVKNADDGIKSLNSQEILLNTDKAKEKIQILANEIKQLEANGVGDKDAYILKLQLQIDTLNAGESIKTAVEDVFKKISEEAKKYSDSTGLSAGTSVFQYYLILSDKDKKTFLQSINQLEALAGSSAAVGALPVSFWKNFLSLSDNDKKAFTSELATVQKTAVSAFEDIGTSIGDSLSNGSNLFENLFSSLFKTLGGGIKQLGAYAIEYSTLKIALFQALASLNPVVGIAIGIALEALGTVMVNSASKVPGFANGVTGFGGGMAWVGERGPELVTLPSMSSVIPNHKLGSIQGGMSSGNLVSSYTIKGADLLVVINRANAANSRNT